MTGSVANDGSYTWVGSDSASLASGDGPSLARTGCNYTMRLLVDGLVAYSQYFTIINEADGPVPNEATCPVERGVARPQFADTTTNSTTIVDDEALSGNGSGGGISTSTLAVAIVVPIVVLLILFGLLLWFGIRRGWFVKLANRRNNNAHLTHENTAGLAQSQPMSPATVEEKKVEDASPAPAYSAPLSELHSDHRAWEAEGTQVRRPPCRSVAAPELMLTSTQVYQLEGDERDARWGDANIRGN